MQKHIECHITGRVQMVMYRDFAMRNAKRLGIVGTVRNLPDGRVHLIAEGDELQLMSYIEKLSKGSALSHVEHIDVDWSNAREGFTDFSIRY
jgi:acylphosphatase